MIQLEAVRPLIESKLSELGLELYEIKWISAGPRSILRVFIDKWDGEVTIDDCERASNHLSMLLDVENFSSASYSFEVSSPGADRPLKTQKDFKKALGHTVKLLVAEHGQQKTLTGKLVGCKNNVLTLTIGDQTSDITLESVVRGNIEVGFK